MLQNPLLEVSHSSVNVPESKQFLQRIKQKVETKSRSKEYMAAAEVAVLKQFFYNKLEGRVLLPLGNSKNSKESLYDQDFSDIDLSEEEDIRDMMASKNGIAQSHHKRTDSNI